MRGRTMILTVLVVLVALGVAVGGRASAAGLQLNAFGSPVFVTGDQRCGGGNLTVTPTGTPSGGQYTQVAVSGITGVCTVGGVAVVQASPPHTVLFSGTGTVSGGAFVVTSSAFTPPATADAVALVSLDGWIVPATWSFTPPPVNLPAVSCRIPSDPSIQCTATVGNGTDWGWPTTTNFNRFYTVSTNHPTPVEWEATINLSSSVWPVFANRLHDTQGGVVLVSTSGCAALPRTVTVRGTTSWGSHHQIWNGQSRTMQFEASTMGTGNLLTCP